MAERDGFEEAALKRILADIDPMSDAAAGMMGMPPGGKKYTQQEIDTEWNWSPIAAPRVRVETMLQLKALGKTNEEITDTLYPNRRRIITTGRTKVEDRIKFAKDMDRRMEKLAAEMGMQMPPAPAEQGAGPQVQETSLSPDPAASLPSVPSVAPPPASAQPAQPSPLDLPATALLGG